MTKMQTIQVHKIGRDAKDIIINDQGVSRHHAELIALKDGRYYLTDCNSASGTFIFRNKQWQKIKQDFVAENEMINLGKSQYTAHELMAMSQKKKPSLSAENSGASNHLPIGKVKRDPITGDIIKSDSPY